MTTRAAVEKVLAKTVRDGDCLVWTGGRNRGGGRGYGVVRLGAKTEGCHRVIARHFIGPCPPGQQVRHLCGRGEDGCVTPGHIVYGTPSENNTDTSRMGRNPKRKLSVEQVQDIRHMHKEGSSVSFLAWRYGLHHSSMTKVVRGQSYAWVETA